MVQDWKLKKGHLRVPEPQLVYCIINTHVLKMLNKSPWAPGLLVYIALFVHLLQGWRTSLTLTLSLSLPLYIL